MKYKIYFSFSLMLFVSVFSIHISAEGLMRPGYGEYKMIDSQSTFTGNVVIEGLAKPEDYKDKKFKVFFIGSERQDIIEKTYVSSELTVTKSDEYYYEIDSPDLIISPYSEKDKQITKGYFNFLVLDESYPVEQIKIFDTNAKIPNTEIEKIEKIFSAEFMKNFPDHVYEDNLQYDTPLVSVRFSNPNWLLVDSYILREGVDYGYGYYVPSSHIEKQDNKSFGQYLYNRKTGETVLLKKYHLIGDAPVMIMGENITYLFYYITIGKSYGQDEIVSLENNKIKTVFTGSTTGS